MGYALTKGQGWNKGYQYVAIIQIILTAILILSLPLWKKRSIESAETNAENSKPLTLKQIVKIPGAREVMVCFFAIAQ